MNDAGVLGDLYQRPYAYDFFQAVRLLRAAQIQNGGASGDDPVRFRTLLSLETPASPIYTLIQPEPFRPPVMTVTFLGLTGSAGTLPTRYTEMLLERRYRYRDQAAHNFFDMFSHRLTTLFYQAWQKHHIFVDYERGGRDGFQRYLLSLLGLGTPGLQQRLSADGVDDQLFAFYAGRFSAQATTVEGLQAILSDQFEVPVSIEQFRGHWMKLDDADRSRLGMSNCTLGEFPMLGQQIWDCQTRLRIQIGPLKRKRFDDFLPQGKAYRALVKMVKFCLGHSLTFEIQLILDKQETPRCILGESSENAARLGWTSWLNRPLQGVADADDVVLAGEISL